MPGTLPEPAASLLWCAAALVAVWVCLPMLFMMLGLSWVRYTVVGGPEALEPTDDDAQYADLFDRLRELGFEPLGARVESGLFCTGHYYKRFPQGRVFATPAGDCFATLYRIFSGHPWRLSFHTVFTDGSLVQTANQMPNMRIEMPGYLRWGHATPDLAELLDLHRNAADNYGGALGLSVASTDLHGICEAVRRHSERYLRAQGPSLGLKCLATPAVFVGMLTFVAGYNFGFNTWAVPVAMILAGVAYSVLHPFSVRDTAQRTYAQDQEAGLARQWARQRRAVRQASLGAPPRRPTYDDERTSDAPRP